jgi:hypothetical protein
MREGVRPLRVLHAPTMVAGIPQSLAAAERKLGLESHSAAFFQTAYGYDADEIVLGGDSGRLPRELRRWRFLLRAAREFDVIHFNAGETIMPQYNDRESSAVRQRLFDAYARGFELRDAAWLRRLGKAVFVSFLGGEARIHEFGKRRFEISYTHDVEGTTSDGRKAQRVARFDRWANELYSIHPDLMWTLPARAQFLPHPGVDLTDWRPVRVERRDRPLVVHAPSERRIKGTAYVEAALERLRAEGVAFDYELVEGMTRTDARKVYERADLLVEQLLLGWYSNLAIELMALGKPVVTYIRDEDLRFVPEEMRRQLPVIDATPDSVYSVLRTWLTERRDELPEVGRAGRSYVERFHDPLVVAARTKADYERALGRR